MLHTVDYLVENKYQIEGGGQSSHDFSGFIGSVVEI
jgi:hypothetical protein